MDSTTRFVDTYTPSPPDNTASYTLVSNIGLALRRIMSYPSTLCLLCATGAHWCPYPLGSSTLIPIYS